ncbi:MAG: AbrB/MazE/SpoVT family DNA-binding domain-containing protein, partial [Nitrospira sp.]|nr:AbrB/MazE/SpoVT family DNA-binding domain-containing protein [Nitrospira sp.]
CHKPMTITLTNEIRSILPPSVRRKAGFRTGDQVEIKASGGIVMIVPKSTPADEYTPTQRKIIDAQLDEAEKGPLHGPFSDGKQIAAYMKTFQAQRRGKSKTKTR